MHCHILGIGGTFMGSLALLAKAAGHQVTGSDLALYSPMKEQLEAAKITWREGYYAEDISFKPDVFIIGNAIKRGNPLLEAVLNENLPFISGPQWLFENILKNRHVLAVAGTHGKTTTSALLTWILECAGFNPSFLIGGVPQNFGVSARLTNSPYFVIEADEYDTAFFDKRSKFVHYHPKTLVLNNLEMDHADIFPDLSAIETQFHHLIRMLPQNAHIIANARSEALSRVLKRGVFSQLSFFNDEHLKVWGSDERGELLFDLDENLSFKTKWNLLGEHNRQNAAAAVCAAQKVGVSWEESLRALSTFQNVKRRMEVRFSQNGVVLYDDFAHHPSAILTTLEGLRRKTGEKAQILAVFEPRSNTMKLGTMKAQLPGALKTADRIFCYAKHLDWDAQAALKPLGNKARAFWDLEEMVENIIQSVQGNTHIVVMSNGSFENIHEKLRVQLEKLLKNPR